ncbi:hypothetical protein E2562_018600 [Oryza meyeriana var. granulata]|uniref:Uncharacterized protein n=1 Tax=Oryza meyeriana var. granulata TaxID=110450 RepID=A0A6G1F9A7_9ORYZ|nr:hypothetical protein E2562_018600 [Oryza meyeriana var. granulata]
MSQRLASARSSTIPSLLCPSLSSVAVAAALSPHPSPTAAAGSMRTSTRCVPLPVTALTAGSVTANMKERLLYLFPILDWGPKGGVSHAELEAWLRRRELKQHKDDDGFVTLHDYLAVDPDQHTDWSNTEYGKPGW